MKYVGEEKGKKKRRDLQVSKSGNIPQFFRHFSWQAVCKNRAAN